MTVLMFSVRPSMDPLRLWAIQTFKLAEMKGNAKQTSIQHHRAVQPLTAIPRLAKLQFGPQTACMDCHCATEK